MLVQLYTIKKARSIRNWKLHKSMASIDVPCVMVHLTLVCSYSFNAQTIITNTVTLYNLWWSCWFTFELRRYTFHTNLRAYCTWMHGLLNPIRNHACVRSGSDNYCIISHHHLQYLCTSPSHALLTHTCNRMCVYIYNMCNSCTSNSSLAHAD